MLEDHLYMQRALALAARGLGQVSPNPMVGCVIVCQNRIVAEGWHRKYGGPHAEIEALNALPTHIDIKKCTIYVSLEPCAHQGQTPSCAARLVEFRPARVVVCNHDPFPLVNGLGLEMLRQAGIEVVTDVLAQQGRQLNRRFFTAIEKKRPYLILKWAQSADGFVAKPDYSPVAISNALCRQLSHRWRGQEDAILVGTNTALYDNPALNTRLWPGPNPLRLVLDPNARLPAELRLFDAQDNNPTWQFNCFHERQIHQNHKQLRLDPNRMLEGMLERLSDARIRSVIVEGGPFLHNAFINSDLWDEMRIFVSPDKLVHGIAAPSVPLKNINSQNMGDNKFYWQIR